MTERHPCMQLSGECVQVCTGAPQSADCVSADRFRGSGYTDFGTMYDSRTAEGQTIKSWRQHDELLLEDE